MSKGGLLKDYEEIGGLVTFVYRVFVSVTYGDGFMLNYEEIGSLRLFFYSFGEFELL